MKRQWPIRSKLDKPQLEAELPVLTQPLLLIMAFAAGASVANIYYNQPLLNQIRENFSVSYSDIGWIPTLTQIGYAAGMLLIVPIGDMIERKKLVLIASVFSAMALMMVALAGTFALVVFGSLLIGISTMTPQFLIPFAATLADPKAKGRVVGTMVSGLLLGILLARTVSGFIGAAYGWRVMFEIAAAFQALILLLLACVLPKSTPSYYGKYLGLLKSVVDIFKQQPVLQEASLFGAMLFGSFSAFWATLIFLMESPAFHLGAKAVGLFGLLGAVAAACTPVVGGMVDRRSPRQVTGLMLALTLFSFLIFGMSGNFLIGIGIGVVVMDLGVQGGHVSNQSRIFALLPNAQSRVQTAYMFFYFAGGALGSFLGTWSFAHFGWIGVCAAAAAMLLIGLFKFARRPELPQARLNH